MSNTTISELADAITSALTEYSEEVGERVSLAVESTAKETVSILKKTSPKNTGDYAKGWRKKKVTDKKGRYVMRVLNKTDCQLTHLLEHGHAKRGGGRVKAIPHIGPAERKAAALLTENIEEAIRK